MIKRNFLLVVVLLATLSSCLQAGSAMEDLKGYAEYLRKALLQDDRPNIEKYGEALTELVLEARVKGSHSLQYRGVSLKKPITAATYGFRETKATPEEARDIYQAIDTLAVVHHRLKTQKFERKESDTPHVQAAIRRYQATMKKLEEGKYTGVLQRLVEAADTSPVPYRKSTYEGRVNLGNIEALAGLGSDHFQAAYKWIQCFSVDTPQDAESLQQQTGITTIVRQQENAHEQKIWEQAKAVFDATLEGKLDTNLYVSKVNSATSLSNFVSKLLNKFGKYISEPSTSVEIISGAEAAITELVKTETGQDAIDDFLQEGNFYEAKTWQNVLTVIASGRESATLTRNVIAKFPYAKDINGLSTLYLLDQFAPVLLRFAGSSKAIEVEDAVERLQAFRAAIAELAEKKTGQDAIEYVLRTDDVLKLLRPRKCHEVLQAIDRDIAGAQLTRAIVTDFRAKGGKFEDKEVTGAYRLKALVEALVKFPDHAVDAADVVERLEAVQGTLSRITKESPGVQGCDTALKRVEEALKPARVVLQDAALTHTVAQGFSFNDEAVKRYKKKLAKQPVLAEFITLVLDCADRAAVDKNAVDMLQSVHGAVSQLTEQKIGQDAINQYVSRGEVNGFRGITQWEAVLEKVTSDLESAVLVRATVKDFPFKDEKLRVRKISECHSLTTLVPALLEFAESVKTADEAADSVKKLQAAYAAIEALVKTAVGQNAMNQVLEKGCYGYDRVKTWQGVLDKIKSDIAAAQTTVEDVNLTKSAAQAFSFSDRTVKQYENKSNKCRLLNNFIPLLLSFANGALNVTDSVEKLDAVQKAMTRLAQEKIGQDAINKAILKEEKETFFKDGTYEGVLAKIDSALEGAKLTKEVIDVFPFKNESSSYGILIKNNYSLDKLVDALITFASLNNYYQLGSIEKLSATRAALVQISQRKVGQDVIESNLKERGRGQKAFYKAGTVQGLLTDIDNCLIGQIKKSLFSGQSIDDISDLITLILRKTSEDENSAPFLKALRVLAVTDAGCAAIGSLHSQPVTESHLDILATFRGATFEKTIANILKA